jgi:hypothetical protein
MAATGAERTQVAELASDLAIEARVNRYIPLRRVPSLDAGSPRRPETALHDKRVLIAAA